MKTTAGAHNYLNTNRSFITSIYKYVHKSKYPTVLSFKTDNERNPYGRARKFSSFYVSRFLRHTPQSIFHSQDGWSPIAIS